MTDSAPPRRPCVRSALDDLRRDTEGISEWEDPSAYDLWPGLPCCVSRALALIILLAMLPGILAALSGAT